MLFWYLWAAIQIVGEMVPISSSGHLALIEQWYKDSTKKTIEFPIISYQSIDSLFDILQLPTIIVVASYFFKRWFFVLINVRRWWKLILKIFSLVLLADIMTCGFYVVIKKYHFITIPLWAGFFITVLILWSLYWCQKSNKKLTYTNSIILGCVQGLALLPGISRYASTFVAARWLGIAPRRAFEISWAIEIPLIIAAFGKSLLFDTDKILWSHIISVPFLALMVGCCTSAWFLLSCGQSWAYSGRFANFGWYLLFPAFLALFYSL